MRPPRNDRQRQPRRRGFDDDNFYGNTPPSPFAGFGPPPSGPEAQATVKWFNPDKGFGFVALSDGTGDVFLHANVLQASGHQSVSSGATVKIRVGQGQKGRQVEQVISVDESTAEPARGGYG
ncbi:MAG: cold-shock protein, partial [Acetobacteraceae bacterium]